MAWTVPRYTRGQINNAGELLVRGTPAPKERQEALEIVNNWRSSHAFPLNTMQMRLRMIANQVDRHPLVAQRIKRLSSIIKKLDRFKTMQFSQMQDLGGCRAVVSSADDVKKIVSMYKKSRIKHKLYDIDDYISFPKPSGYRGVHLKYSYFSDKNDTYNGLKVEMQLRSKKQHAWATAVETVGTFTDQALKSSQGEQDWLRFFALMSSEIANLEGTTHVPGTPTDRKALIKEIVQIAKKLNVVSLLTTYGQALKTIDPISGFYFLLVLDPEEKKVAVTSYRKNQLAEASEEYLRIESSIEGRQEAVLVSVDSVNSLQRAYPNYFLDTKVFTSLVEDAIKREKTK